MGRAVGKGGCRFEIVQTALQSRLNLALGNILGGGAWAGGGEQESEKGNS
jgi:hypothetical protein